MPLQRVTPGLTSNTLVTSKTIPFSDVDLSFSAKPGSKGSDGVFRGDIYKKQDVAAVLQAVENILLTSTLEKPFEPSFGANIRSLLFENTNALSENFISTLITTSLQRWEPRAKVEEIRYYGGNDLISSGVEDLRSYITNEIRIEVELIVNNVGIVTTVNMNRFR